MVKNKVVLVILDGFGLGEEDKQKNAIFAANTPFFDQIFNQHQFASLYASEEPVGILKNQFGNSELGHMTIGSGRTIENINYKLNCLIDNNQMAEFLLAKPWIKEMIDNNEVIHICGIYSAGSVHGNKKHIDALVDFFQSHHKKIALHLISDGRDTSPRCFLSDLKDLKKHLLPSSKIVSVSGRYYAMDRDKNFDRTNQFYLAMNQANETFINQTVEEYIESQYQLGLDDEYIKPKSFINNDEYKITSTSPLIFTNYRADRIRQIIHCFKKSTLFSTEFNFVDKNNVIGICEYPNMPLSNIMIEKQVLTNTLGEILNRHKIKQLRIAETEKFAHVNFFFDGGVDVINQNQDKILINSLKVTSYDQCPEMSAETITNTLVSKIADYDFILVNYANADMVGHTGNFLATKKAIEILDKQCSTLYNYLIDKYNGTLIITSDHGNADFMVDSNSSIVKTHSIAKVPFIVLSNDYCLSKYSGSLQDVAPSILYLYDLDKPNEMTGSSLIIKK